METQLLLCLKLVMLPRSGQNQLIKLYRLIYRTNNTLVCQINTFRLHVTECSTLHFHQKQFVFLYINPLVQLSTFNKQA